MSIAPVLPGWCRQTHRKHSSQAELLELKANPNQKAHGNVDPNRVSTPAGPARSLLVPIRRHPRQGRHSLRCPLRTRPFHDGRGGKRPEGGGPSVAVRVLGLNRGTGGPDLSSSPWTTKKAAQDLAEERAHTRRKGRTGGLRPKRQTQRTSSGTSGLPPRSSGLSSKRTPRDPSKRSEALGRSNGVQQDLTGGGSRRGRRDHPR